MNAQLKPIDEPFPSDLAEILDRYPHQDGYLLQLFRVFANSKRFLQKGVANLLDQESPLTLRERELVILRVCFNQRCEYEWGVHVAVFASRAGLSEEEVEGTTSSEPGIGWSKADETLLNVVDELCAEARVEQNLAAFQAIWPVESQLEIIALVGNYHTICLVANTSQLELEAFSARFPASSS